MCNRTPSLLHNWRACNLSPVNVSPAPFGPFMLPGDQRRCNQVRITPRSSVSFTPRKLTMGVAVGAGGVAGVCTAVGGQRLVTPRSSKHIKLKQADTPTASHEIISSAESESVWGGGEGAGSNAKDYTWSLNKSWVIDAEDFILPLQTDRWPVRVCMRVSMHTFTKTD